MDLLTTSSSIKHFVFLLIATCGAFFLQSLTDSPAVSWMVWSILLATLITSHHTWSRRLVILLTTSIAAVIGSILGSYIAGLDSHLLSLYLFCTTFLCVFLSEKYPQCFYPFFLINLLIILSSGFSGSELDNLERGIFLSLGFITAMAIQMVWWPLSYKDDLRQSIQIVLAKLKKLNQDIFACFIQIEYSKNVYLYEKRIHEDKNKFILALGEANALYKSKQPNLSEKEKNRYGEALIKADKLFDIMLDYSQLRRRVTDATTFQLAEDEFKKIVNDIDADLSALMFLLRNKKMITGGALQQNIKHFEDNYQNVLRVSAREPLVFLLFIFSLKAMNAELRVWIEELTA